MVTTFELPGCTDMWTVRGMEEKSDIDKTTEEENDTEKVKKYTIQTEKFI